MPATKKKAAPKKADGNWEGERLIGLVAAESGAGKTYFMASLKDFILYDSDFGGGAAYAEPMIQKNGGERVEVGSYPDVLADLRRRVKDGTLKKTIVIDHVTSLHQEAGLRHNPELLDDFGRSGNKATAEWRKVREFVRNFDCNLLVVAHIKGKWANQKMVGEAADGAKNIEGDMGFVLHVKKNPNGLYPSTAHVAKWRRLPDDPRGQVPATFPFTVDKFAEIAGAGLTRDRHEVNLATEDQVRKILALLEVVKIAETTVKTWFTKAGVDDFPQMTEGQAAKVIEHITKKIPKEPAA